MVIDGPSFKDGCDTHIANKDVGNIIHVNISSAEKGQYGVAGHFKVYLYVAAKDYMKLWSKTYKLPVISVSCFGYFSIFIIAYTMKFSVREIYENAV
jgi:hypothetical protein